MTPSLSVIIRAHNSQPTLKDCLCAIRASSYNDYELLVVDDASSDLTPKIAAQYADRVVGLAECRGRNYARYAGTQEARAEIIVYVDSDVLVKPDTLGIIHSYLSSHPQVEAVTGLLSKSHPNRDFFSQYKNLYMNYIFSGLPERIAFLYGSICAVRKRSAHFLDVRQRYAEDTLIGMKIAQQGKEVGFLKNLEVIHLKKYNFSSFIRNDFLVSFFWARLLVAYQGWEQIGKNKTAFMHSPRWQVASVLLAPCILAAGFLNLYLALCLVLVWCLLNFKFLKFLAKEQGIFFALRAFFVTFLDNLVMVAGIMSGFVGTAIFFNKNTHE